MPTIARFGAFAWDPRYGELRKRGVPVRLSAQSREILALLLERPGEIVPRQTVRDRLWPEETDAVFDQALNRAVHQLRTALDDPGAGESLIEVLPGQGFRFHAGPPAAGTTPPAPGIYRFDDVVVDKNLFRVEKAGAPLDLEPKAMRVLLYLIENRERVASKHDLLAAVWEGAFVTDNALSRVVAQLRGALGDDVRRPRYIETVPALGYRFIGEMPGERVTPAPARPGQPKPVRKAALLAGSAVAIVAVAATAARMLAPAARHGSRTARVLRLQQVTRSGAFDMSPSFSPDGSAIAYASNRDGHFQIYVEQLAPGGGRVQLTRDTQENIQPAWSPDGSFVAYHSIARNAIFKVPALGGAPARLTDFGSQPAWSPDGKWLAFRSQRAASLELDAMMPDQPSTLWIVPAEGGAARGPIQPNSGPFERVTAPRFSPDGRRLVFLRSRRPRPPELWSLEIESRDAVRIECPLTIAANPAFSADGAALYLAGSSSAAEFGVWRLPIDSRTHQATAAPAVVTLTGAGHPSQLAVSRDGRRLAYAAQSEASTLRSLPLQKRAGVPSGPATQFTPGYWLRSTLPAFSPDGSRVAWCGVYQGSGSEIWVADANGANAAPLVTGLESYTAPRWAPGGRSLFYMTGQRAVTIWSVSLEDRGRRKVADAALPASFAAISPDGREMAYAAVAGGVANVWKVPVAGGQPVQLTFEKFPVTFPLWSPDGRWLAANLSRGHDKHTAVFAAGGGVVFEITHGPGLDLPVAWSPDSDKVVFAGQRNGVWNLYWAGRSTGEIRRLTEFHTPGGWVRTAAWSPRDDQIVYEQMDMKGDIFLAELAPPAQ